MIEPTKLFIGEIHGRKVSACVDKDSMWVELITEPNASPDFGPEGVRKLAHFLEGAANAAENMSRFPDLYLSKKEQDVRRD